MTTAKASLCMGAEPTATPPLLQAGFLSGPDPGHGPAQDEALQPPRRERHEEHEELEDETRHDHGLAALEAGERPAGALPRVEADEPRRLEELEAGHVVELGVDRTGADLRDDDATALDLEPQGLGEAGDEVLGADV